MKKITIWIMTAAVLLLLTACVPTQTIDPTGIPVETPTPIMEPSATPAPTITPVKSETITPTLTVTPTVTGTPTVVPTVPLQATVVPPETPGSVPSPTPSPTSTPVPSPTPTTVPTVTLVPQETRIPEPTETPGPTATPTPSPSPTATPSPSPAPTINPAPLVANGWQRAVSFDEAYSIIFPELFRGSELSRTDRELRVRYTCKENTEIEFVIQYVMKQTLEEAEKELVQKDGIIVEQFPEEYRISYMLEQDGVMYQGILLETQYSRALLGDSFGEEEWITGSMNVLFAYPAEHSEEYQTEQYAFYVVQNGEEN